MLYIDYKAHRRNVIRSVFYVYHEAGLSLFCLFIAGIEFASSFAMPEPFFVELVQAVAAFFAVCGLLMALYVVRDARKHRMYSMKALDPVNTCIALVSVVFFTTVIYCGWIA